MNPHALGCVEVVGASGWVTPERKSSNSKQAPTHGHTKWSSPQWKRDLRLPRTGRRTEEPELSALTAPGPHIRPTGTAHPAADIAPGCGAGKVEGPSQAPRPAGVSGDRVFRSLTYRSCGLNRGESVQPRAPNGLGRAGPRRTRPRWRHASCAWSWPRRPPRPEAAVGHSPVRPGPSGTARGDGEALNHPPVEQGPRTPTPYRVSQVAQSRQPEQRRTPQARKPTITRSS
jgi:hypothetical protein